MRASIALLGLVTLLAAVSPASAHRAPAPAPADGGADADADALAKPRARLLRTASGAVLRVRARVRDGVWEIERDRVWSALPDGLVTGSALEADVLADWRRRLHAARDDETARVALVEWGLEQGLIEEALATLDGTLAAGDSVEAARAVLRRHAWRVGVPRASEAADEALETALDEVFAFGARATPSLRELLVLDCEQLDIAALRALRERLEPALVGADPGARAFAALMFTRLFGGEARAALQRRALVDRAADVRHQASLALRAAEDATVIVPLVDALASEHPTIRVHAAQALGTMGYAAAVGPLVSALAFAPAGGGGSAGPRSSVFFGRQIAFVQGIEAEIAQNAAIGAPIIGTLQEGVTLDARVHGVSSSGPSAARAIDEALRRLTGADPGRSARAWARWWEENEANWPARDFWASLAR